MCVCTTLFNLLLQALRCKLFKLSKIESILQAIMLSNARIYHVMLFSHHASLYFTWHHISCSNAFAVLLFYCPPICIYFMTKAAVMIIYILLKAACSPTTATCRTWYCHSHFQTKHLANISANTTPPTSFVLCAIFTTLLVPSGCSSCCLHLNDFPLH